MYVSSNVYALTYDQSNEKERWFCFTFKEELVKRIVENMRTKYIKRKINNFILLKKDLRFIFRKYSLHNLIFKSQKINIYISKFILFFWYIQKVKVIIFCACPYMISLKFIHFIPLYIY